MGFSIRSQPMRFESGGSNPEQCLRFGYRSAMNDSERSSSLVHGCSETIPLPKCRMIRHNLVWPMSVLPINKLRALYWAEVHMREALYTCKHLLALRSENQELRRCIYTGIVISYARSFSK